MEYVICVGVGVYSLVEVLGVKDGGTPNLARMILSDSRSRIWERDMI
jgi:hypothetical protein